ncbi:nuclear transport factor 2 family protein [Salegentibacter salegens]|uniref:SnoaL-like domain-containing protein n=1 Tax=Salegentibacter salegens TaxID=143223 RepID=A0A1M7K718_9FLAO|nr:nuclear transport factor 2 family protein [Salegentibacter salegens]PRX43141.1 SnoaL-like protein [Salegentibacter salegens]SHM61004.1 SnoaL-like domain-containing protein [Salegentibacter salegens]
MKRILQILIMFLAVTTIGQNSEKTNEDQIKDLIENSFQKIFSDMDTQALETYCTPDFLLLETGEVWDMEKMRNYIKKASEQNTQVKRINSFDFIEIKIEGKMAWIAYRNKAEFKSGDRIVREINWLESASAILTEEGWKLQLLHSTIVKE